jgi:hypothetical protein
MDIDISKIAARAYQLSQERFGTGKAPLDDWLKAEWEVKNGFNHEPGNMQMPGVPSSSAFGKSFSSEQIF